MRRRIGWGLLAALLLSPVMTVAAQFGGPNPVLSKTMSPQRPKIGSVARMTITATNFGSANADNVVITDPLPDNMELVGGPTTTQGSISYSHRIITVYAGTLPPGQTVTVTHDVVVTREFAQDTPYTNCTGLTFKDGTARLACFPFGPAYDPVSVTTPPSFLPEAGAAPNLAPLGAFVLGLASLLASARLRARR